MSAVIEGRAVARKTGHGGDREGAGRPPKAVPRDDVTTKVNRELAAMAAYVARRKKMTLAEYLEQVLRPTVERDFASAQPGQG